MYIDTQHWNWPPMGERCMCVIGLLCSSLDLAVIMGITIAAKFVDQWPAPVTMSASFLIQGSCPCHCFGCRIERPVRDSRMTTGYDWIPCRKSGWLGDNWTLKLVLVVLFIGGSIIRRFWQHFWGRIAQVRRSFRVSPATWSGLDCDASSYIFGTALTRLLFRDVVFM